MGFPALILNILAVFTITTFQNTFWVLWVCIPPQLLLLQQHYYEPECTFWSFVLKIENVTKHVCAKIFGCQ